MTHKRSWQRPIADQKKFDSEYDRIFAKPQVTVQVDGAPIENLEAQKLPEGITGLTVWADRCHFTVRDELEGNGTTYEEASKDEMKLHQEKMEKK